MSDTGYMADLLPVEKLLQSLQGLLSMVKIYQANNQLVLNNIQQLVEAADSLLEGNDWLVIHLENGSFFVNDEKLLRRRGVENILDNFYNFLEERAVPGFRITAGVSSATPEDMTGFAGFLNGCGEQPEPAEWLEVQLLKNDINWISILQPDESFLASKEQRPPEQDQAGEKEPPGRRYPKKIYAYTLRALRDVTQKVSESQSFSMRKTGRMIQTMVEEVLAQDEDQLLALSTVRDHHDYIFIHSVNVTILALYVGRQLGLSREVMENLGICALFHDLGKCIIPDELLYKREQLSKAEIKQVRKHSIDSVLLVLQLMVAPAERKVAFMVSAFEHHLQVDHRGYPDMGWRKSQGLFSKIIEVADAYDALTSSRVYRRQPMSGDRALGLMFKGSSSVFDPLILKVFVRLLGIYPLGTILEFNNGQKAMVCAAPSSADLSRPVVMLLEEDGPGWLARDDKIDLATSTSDLSAREVVDSCHPGIYNIQPARFII